jgi:hypothetical protein
MRIWRKRTCTFCIPREIIFYLVLQPSWGRVRPVVDVSSSHTITKTHTLGRTPLNEWTARYTGRYLQDTNTTEDHRCRHRDSNLRSQQSNSRRPRLRLKSTGINFSLFYCCSVSKIASRIVKTIEFQTTCNVHSNSIGNLVILQLSPFDPDRPA